MMSYEEFIKSDKGYDYLAYWGNWEDSYAHYCKDNEKV
jgi:hypothetical protein